MPQSGVRLVRIAARFFNKNRRKPSADFRGSGWQRWQLTAVEVGPDGLGDGGDGVVAALFQGTQDAHQHRLGLGTVLAAVGIAVLPRDHRRADLTLGVIVVERHLDVVQEREQLRGVAPQSLHQASRMALLPRL